MSVCLLHMLEIPYQPVQLINRETLVCTKTVMS